MKYDIDFKAVVISYYQQGHSGRKTAWQFDIDIKDVLKWVNQYESGGMLSIKLKMRKATYTATFKLHVITLMSKEQLSLYRAELGFDISSPALLSAWRKRYASEGELGLLPRGKPMSHSYITSKPDDEKTHKKLKRELE